MNRYSISTLLVIMLSACGGGGSGDSSSSTTSPLPVPAAPTAITVKAVYKDACGNETNATDAALLIHNNDYSNKAIVSANNNGEMTYESDNTTETISIVIRGKDEVDGVKPINLTTYIEHPIIDMGTIFLRNDDQSQCSCQTYNLYVNTPARPLDRGQPEISGINKVNNTYSYQGYAEFNGVEQCTQNDQQLPLITSQITYDDPDEAFAAIIPNALNLPFDERLNGYTVDALIEGTPVDIISDNQGRLVSAFIGSRYYLYNDSFNNEPDNVYSFASEQIDFYDVSSFTVDFIDIPDVDSSYTHTATYMATTNTQQTFDLPRVDIDYTKLLDILVSESGNYSIASYSAFDFITVSVVGSNDQADVIDWTIYGPTSGQVPKIENLDLTSFISDDDLNLRAESLFLRVSAVGFDGITDYNDYLRSKVNKTLEDNIQVKWANENTASFNIFTSGENLTSATSAIPTKALFQNAKLSMATEAKAKSSVPENSNHVTKDTKIEKQRRAIALINRERDILR